MTDKAPPIEELAQPMISIAQRAGAVIMDIYSTNPNTRYKADRSPVTDADHAAENLILEISFEAFP